MPLMKRLLPNILFMLIHCLFIKGTENKLINSYALKKSQKILKVTKNKENLVYYKREKLFFIKNKSGKKKEKGQVGVEVEIEVKGNIKEKRKTQVQFKLKGTEKGQREERGIEKRQEGEQRERDNKRVQRLQSAYLVFDIIKIFGRLSNKELLGHVISHNNEFTDLESTKRKKKKNWEILFEKDSSITFEKFQVFLKNTKFEWPLTVNSGQIKNQGSIDIPVAPIVYVENCRKLTEEHKSKNKNLKLNIKTVNDFVDELPIANDAIQCVFSSFSDLEYLTKTHFINKIHEWAPSDGIIDWYTFVYNLKEDPSDNIRRFLD